MNTYKNWRKYIENADKAFDSSLKKIEKIRSFLKQYELLINSINDFKKNLQFVKRYTINNSYKIRKDSTNALSGASDGREKSSSSTNNNNLMQCAKNINSHQIENQKLKNNPISNRYNVIQQGSSSNISNNYNRNSNPDLNNLGGYNNRINYYIDTINSIKDLEPNLTQNKNIIYEFYRACSIFYVESKS